MHARTTQYLPRNTQMRKSGKHVQKHRALLQNFFKVSSLPNVPCKITRDQTFEKSQFHLRAHAAAPHAAVKISQNQQTAKSTM